MAAKPKIQIIIDADTSRFMREMNATISYLQSTARKFQAIGTSIGYSFVAPISAALGVATKQAGDFNDSIIKLETQVGLSRKEAEGFRDTFMQLSEQFGVTPVDAAAAGYATLSTGLRDAAKANTILETSLKLVAVGLGDSYTLTKLLTTTVAAYGLTTEQVAHAGDILLQTVRDANIEAPELQNTFGNVVGIAGQMGISLEQVTTVLARMTETLPNAAEAVTGLRNIFADILGPSAKGEQILLNMTDTMGKKLFPTLDEFRKKIAEDFIGTMYSIENALPDSQIHDFNDNLRGLAAAFAAFREPVAGGTSQLEKLRTTLTNMQNSTGVLDQAFARAKETWGFAFNSLTAAVSRAAISFGEELLPNVLASMKVLQDFLKILVEAAKPWAAWILGITAASAALAAFLIVATGATLVLTTIAGAVTSTVGVLVFLGGAIVAVVETFFGLLTITGLVTAALTVFDGVVAFTYALLASIPTILALVVAAVVALGAAFYAVNQGIMQSSELSSNAFVRIWQIAVANVKLFFLDMEKWLLERVRAFIAFVKGDVSIVDPLLSDVNALRAAAENLANQDWIAPETKKQLVDLGEQLKKIADIKLLPVKPGEVLVPDKDQLKEMETGLKDLGKIMRDAGTAAGSAGLTEWQKKVAEGFKDIAVAGAKAHLSADEITDYQNRWKELAYTIESADIATNQIDAFSSINEMIVKQQYDLKTATGQWTDFERAIQEGIDGIVAAGKDLDPADLQVLIDEWVRWRTEVENAPIKFNFIDQLHGLLGDVTNALMDSTDKWASLVGVFKDRATKMFTDLAEQWIDAKFKKIDATMIPNFTNDLPGAVADFASQGLNSMEDFFSGIAKSASDWLGGLFSGGAGGGGIGDFLGSIGSSLFDLLPVFGAGGIVTGPTLAMVGDSGPEAVIPLNRLDHLESGGTPVTVVVNSPSPTSVKDRQDGGQRNIEVTVEDVVARSLASGGRVATTLQKFYDVRRSGGSR